MNEKEQLKEQIKELQRKLAKMEKKEKEPKVWKPKYDDEYWYIDNNGVIRHDYWLNVDADEFRYNAGNCFKTLEEAEKALEKIKIYTQLKRYAKERNTETIDWTNSNQDKYYICYTYITDSLEIECVNLAIDIGQIYFTSKEICKQAIKEIGEDNIKKLFEED